LILAILAIVVCHSRPAQTPAWLISGFYVLVLILCILVAVLA
jgi:hypothetical protein